MTQELADSFLFRLDAIYGVKKFIPPSYEIWEYTKDSWLRKRYWKKVCVTTNPINFANKPIVMRSNMGVLIGYDHLLEKFEKDKPHE